MSPRLFQRRQFDEWLRDQLIDEAFASYLDWLAESEAVNAAYAVWSTAAASEGAVSFAAYGAALDREEGAATAYRSVIDRLDELFGGGERLADARPAGPRHGVTHPASR